MKGRAGRDRHANITEGVRQAQDRSPTVQVVGEVARPCLEGWVLAALGEAATEQMSKAAAQRRLADRCAAKDTAAFAQAVHRAAAFPEDARGVRRWIAGVRDCLTPS